MSEFRVVENERRKDMGPRLNVDRGVGVVDDGKMVAGLNLRGCLERNEGIRIELELWLFWVVEVKNL